MSVDAGRLWIWSKHREHDWLKGALSLAWEKTYNLCVPPEKAMLWSTYAELLKPAWSCLIGSSRLPEAMYQEFLETHPCMLPWPYHVFAGGHHGVFPSAVISQPILPGLVSKIPDFLWLARDSANFMATFIEIEAPDKPWGTNSGQPSHQFTQAVNQLKDWQAWFADPLNIELFKRDYHISAEMLRGRPFIQRYILIYGRRSDPTLTDELNAKRHLLQGPNEVYMTYDRLAPCHELMQCLTVKLVRGSYEAICVPPTTMLCPHHAENWAMIKKKEQAVMANPLIPGKRKAFLVERWLYWDNWAMADGHNGAMGIGDCE